MSGMTIDQDAVHVKDDPAKTMCGTTGLINPIFHIHITRVPARWPAPSVVRGHSNIEEIFIDRISRHLAEHSEKEMAAGISWQKGWDLVEQSPAGQHHLPWRRQRSSQIWSSGLSRMGNKALGDGIGERPLHRSFILRSLDL
jgi:hypothetical protein